MEFCQVAVTANPARKNCLRNIRCWKRLSTAAFIFWLFPLRTFASHAVFAGATPQLIRSQFATLLLMVGFILLIFGVEFWGHYEQKRRYRSYLVEGEERFRGLTDAMSLLIWMCDERGSITYANQAAINFVSSDPVKHDWTVSAHPDDFAELISAVTGAIEKKSGFSKEFRLRRADGVYRWVLAVAAPRRNGDGSFAGLIGYGSDITDQKLAEEALRDVGGRMIEAQEQERSRIARELHDDICQKLAVLSMQLEMSKSPSSAVGSAANRQIEDMRRNCTSIAEDVQALSHELHSSRLDYLGLEVALESFCQEISQQQNINVDCRCENVPETLTKAISLSLFRIAQEGVHNSLKYSGADRCSVLLRGGVRSIELEVGDSGDGFDVEIARGGKSLGLISMQERAHLVNGNFRIESVIGGGTRILVIIPLPGQTEDRAAGDLLQGESDSRFGKNEAATEQHR